MPLNLAPIGYMHCQAQWPYDVPRQGILAGENLGVIELLPGQNFEQALTGLEGFSHLWLLFQFDRNDNWKPMVQPPRHINHKIGLFATRSPYRPNPIGLSCVKLIQIQGRKLFISRHDLLDMTPILDIKPYLPYADSFPSASAGWTAEKAPATNTPENIPPQYKIRFSDSAEGKITWLEQHGVPCLRSFITTNLEYEPLNPHRHRLIPPKSPQIVPQPCHLLAYRTWRIEFWVNEPEQIVKIEDLCSGYSQEELLPNAKDPYQDKEIHHQFIRRFSL